MYKKTTLFLASITLILTGCGNKDEFAKGEALYQKGDFESLVEAKKFFNTYVEKNPEDNDVNEYIAKVDKALIAEAKEKTTEAYDNKEIEKAMEYITIAKEGAPKDKEIQEAYDLIEKSYDDQMMYNEFTNYLEDRYIEMKNITDQWDNAVKSIETGKSPSTYAIAVAKALYPSVVDVRDKVNAESFTITEENTDNFKQANTTLFDYIVNIEKELSSIMTNSTIGSDFKESVNYITPAMFNSTFLSLQETASQFAIEKDMEGNDIRNIADTLNFTEAYEKNKEETAKKLLEQQQAAQTKISPTTSPSNTP